MRFALRSLFVLSTVVAIGFGIWAWHHFKERRFEQLQDDLFDRKIQVDWSRELEGLVDVTVYESSWQPDAETRAMLSELPELDVMRLYDFNFSREQSDLLFSLPGIRQFEAMGGELTPFDWTKLCKRTNLREIDMDYCTIPVGGLEKLASMTSLMRLRLSYPEYVGEVDRIPQLLKAPNLRFPVLSKLEECEVEIPIPVEFAGQPELKKLGISSGGSILETSGHVRLETCPQLRSLTISIRHSAANEPVLSLATQPALTVLTIKESGLGRDDVLQIAKQPTLRTLVFDMGQIFTDARAVLGELDRLEELKVHETGIVHSEAELEALLAEGASNDVPIPNWSPIGDCLRLNALELFVDVSKPEDLTWLGEMKQLRRLDISGMRPLWKKSGWMTAADFPGLQRLKFLDELVVHRLGMPESELKQILPRTEVVEH